MKNDHGSNQLGAGRAWVRLVLLAGLTAGSFILWGSGMVATLPLGSARRRWRAAMFRTWCRAAGRVIGMSLEVRGGSAAGAFRHGVQPP